MRNNYCIRDDYRPRLRPEYFDDTVTDGTGVIWQPDVYRRAREIADGLHAPTLVDVGSGTGEKLVDIAGTRRVIAWDLGSNFDRGVERHPEFLWRSYDAEVDEALPIAPQELRGAVLICSDVIEHVPRPDRLLRALCEALADGAAVVIVSTPDRERTWGRDHLGPPPNPAHVREWTLPELVALCKREGLTCGVSGWTRPHDKTYELTTIELVFTVGEATLDACGIARRRRVGTLRASSPVSHGARAKVRRTAQELRTRLHR